MPLLVVIGGPDGSGKTTLTSYLIAKGRIKTNVINPDDIAINKFGSYNFRIKAAKVALEERKSAIENRIDFAFESTFSGNSEINEILKAKEAGYKTVLYYVTLPTASDNVIRVAERETNSGHTVNFHDTIRRYAKSRENILKYLDLFDDVYLFDNAGASRSRVAIFRNGRLIWLNSKHKDHPFYKELFT